MIKVFFKKIILLGILIFLLNIPTTYLIADNLNYKISSLEVFKRNKASCNRLGNVYDACQWMTKVTIKNTGTKQITNLCFIMKVNKKLFELCYGKEKKISINRKDEKTFLINLTELMNISIDEEKPLIKIISKR